MDNPQSAVNNKSQVTIPLVNKQIITLTLYVNKMYKQERIDFEESHITDIRVSRYLYSKEPTDENLVHLSKLLETAIYDVKVRYLMEQDAL